jgi:hypothetical protein
MDRRAILDDQSPITTYLYKVRRRAGNNQSKYKAVAAPKIKSKKCAIDVRPLSFQEMEAMNFPAN